MHAHGGCSNESINSTALNPNPSTNPSTPLPYTPNPQLIHQLHCPRHRSPYELATLASLCCQTVMHTLGRAVTCRISCVRTPTGIPHRFWAVETICRTTHESAYSLPHRQEFDRSLFPSRALSLSLALFLGRAGAVFLRNLSNLLLRAPSALSIFICAGKGALSIFTFAALPARKTSCRLLRDCGVGFSRIMV